MINQKMYGLGANQSRIRMLFEYGLERAAEVGKENVYDYSLGNPSVPAPETVKNAAEELFAQDPVALHGYTPAAGDMKARIAVAENLAKKTGYPVRPENIFFTCGAAPAVVSTLKALRATGSSEVLIIAPYFSEYTMYVEAAGCKYVEVPADTEHFQIRLDKAEELINENTQAIMVNSPNNPSGVVYSRETLEKLADLLTRKSNEFGHPIYIVADEPYRELVYDGLTVPFIPEIYPNTVVCYSWSKSLSLPGERIGYFFVPDEAEDSRALFFAIQGASRTVGHVCAPSLLQKIAARCVDTAPDTTVYQTNRQILYDELTSYGFRCVWPQGAFYMLVAAPDGNDIEFSERAKELDLLIVPTVDFGCPGFVRLSTCVSTDMVKRSLPAFKNLARAYGLIE